MRLCVCIRSIVLVRLVAVTNSKQVRFPFLGLGLLKSRVCEGLQKMCPPGGLRHGHSTGNAASLSGEARHPPGASRFATPWFPVCCGPWVGCADPEDAAEGAKAEMVVGVEFD